MDSESRIDAHLPPASSLSRTRSTAVTVAAWFGLFCVNVLGILPWARIKFPIIDLPEMVYEVRRLQLGYVPYKDTFTHHFLGYVIPVYAVGFAFTLSPLVLKMMAICFNFVTAILVWHILREVSRPHHAWLGALLTVTLGWFWSWQGYGFNVQACLTPMIAAVLLGAVQACTRSRRASLYGAAFWSGCLLIGDQRTLVYLVLPAIPFLFVPEFRRWRVVLIAVFSLAIVPACGASYLWQADAWNDFVQQTLVFPMQYRNHGVPFSLGPWLSTGLGTMLGGERIAMPLMLAALAAALACERRRSLQVLWLASVVCATAYAMLGGRAYPNYFLVFGPIVLVMVSLIPHYLAGRWPTLAAASTALLLALGIFCGARPTLLYFNTGSVFLPSNERTVESVVEYLRTYTTPQDGVLVWGFAPQIYVLSDRFRTFRDAGLLSIAGANFGSSSADDQKLVPQMVDEFDEYLVLNPPKVIVVYGVTRESCLGQGVIQRNLDYQHNQSLGKLRDLISSSYRSELVVEGPCDRAEILVKRQRMQD